MDEFVNNDRELIYNLGPAIGRNTSNQLEANRKFYVILTNKNPYNLIIGTFNLVNDNTRYIQVNYNDVLI